MYFCKLRVQTGSMSRMSRLAQLNFELRKAIVKNDTSAQEPPHRYFCLCDQRNMKSSARDRRVLAFLACCLPFTNVITWTSLGLLEYVLLVQLLGKVVDCRWAGRGEVLCDLRRGLLFPFAVPEIWVARQREPRMFKKISSKGTS